MRYTGVSVSERNQSVNTMTDNTKTLGIRLKIKDKEELAKHLTRECAESMLRQIIDGEIELTPKGVVFLRVNTESQSVNTAIEPLSEDDNFETFIDRSVNTDCDNCPYMNDLNMSGFDEVCEFKGIDRQKALDKCVQMIWR